MIKTVLLNQNFCCYFPLGNTPAVSLTADLPPEQDADILLLGSGDARNVLFTCFTDVARKIDVTCCDIEPLVQARNVLLYSLLIEDTKNLNIDRIWNIYFHWKLDMKSLKLLEAQTQKLLQVSETIDQWHDSVYGSNIRFCDKRSLSIVRSYWMGFQLRGLSESEKANRLKQLQAAYDRVIDVRGNRPEVDEISAGGLRGVSPLGLEAGKDLFKVSKEWWTRGVMPSSKASAQKSPYLNPAFFYSPDASLLMNSSLEPLVGIPLCTAYSPITKGSAFYVERKAASSPEYLVDCAKIHLMQWASAFRRAVGNKSVIRIFCGDALSFCFTLHNCQLSNERSTNLSSDNLTSGLLELSQSDYGSGDNAAPLRFDVIDTSNLFDLLGPLNVMPIASALLKHNASSILYTEMLIQRYSSLAERLNNLFGVDLHTMSLLLGLVAPDVFTNATESFEEDPLYDEIIELPPDHPGEGFARSRVRWRKLHVFQESCDVRFIHMEAKALAKFLVQVHNEMFKHEDIDKVFKMFSQSAEPENLSKLSNLYYNRASFACLLSFFKANIASDWNECVKELYSIILTVQPYNSTMPYYTQELLFNMHLYGVDSRGFLKPSPSDLKYAILAPILPKGDVPEQLCVTIRVPREQLKVFTNKKRIELGYIGLTCSFIVEDSIGKEWKHSFSTVKMIFGTCRAETKEDDLFPYIDEDNSQLSGTSDMFVSVMVPTKLLLQARQSVPWVWCELIRTPESEGIFASELAKPLLCFAQEKMASKNVFVTRYMPGMSASPTFALVSSQQDLPTSAAFTIRLKDDEPKIKALIQRITLEAQVAKDKLAIPSSSVEIEFQSPLIASVTIADSEKLEFKFPVPVSPSKYKVRIARKSSYIEVETPLFDPLTEDAASFIFPTSITETSCGATVPMPWTSSHVDLDVMPPIDLEDKLAISWLIGHVSLMFSNREQRIRESNSLNPARSLDTRTDLKSGLFAIFMHYAGLKCQQVDFFALSKVDGVIQTLIFPSCLRLDLVNHTVLLDIALIPLTKTVFNDPRAVQFIQELSNLDLCQVKVTEAENRAWKAMMPALVERCRTTATWKHAPSCEYIEAGKVPLPRGLSEDDESSICSCGVGKFPPGDYLQSQMKKLSDLSYMISQYATRAAIAPVFAVPYVEDCSLKELSDKLDSMTFFSLDDFISKILREAIKRGVYNKEKCIIKAKCVACGRTNRKSVETAEQKLLLCAKCKLVSYCSAECQKKDWRKHKLFCSA